MDILFCEKCGGVLREGERYCPHCGEERISEGLQIKIVLPRGVGKLTVETEGEERTWKGVFREEPSAPVSRRGTLPRREPVQPLTDEELAKVVVPDEDHWKVLEYVAQQQEISISVLQRKFCMGYAKAGHIIEWMEKNRFVGDFGGMKSRPVYITPEMLAKIKR